jgi:hypothetical protein
VCDGLEPQHGRWRLSLRVYQSEHLKRVQGPGAVQAALGQFLRSFKLIKTVEMAFEFKETIPRAPQASTDMYAQACSNDTTTVNAWREKWINNARANKKRFGTFKEHGLGQMFGINQHRPAIVVGSGPSLKQNIQDLKEARKAGILIVSCLHNFQAMHDAGITVDYYVSLDAGEVVVEEISEGGKKTHAEYLEATKDAHLLAFVGSHPKLFDSWKGKVSLFNCPVPDQGYRDAIKELEPFWTFVSTGGNVLGACMYIAKAIFGSGTIIYVGADFAFSYTRKFHAWDSKYDASIGQCLRCVDVWGNSVLTWQSYYNFKIWFDWVAENVPGTWINCTEGGLLGSYPEGNIANIRQMRLKDCVWMYSLPEQMRAQCEKPEIDDGRVLF